MNIKDFFIKLKYASTDGLNVQLNEDIIRRNSKELSENVMKNNVLWARLKEEQELIAAEKNNAKV